MQSVLTRLCYAKSFAASRGKPNIRPPTRGVELGQWRPSAFCSPRRPARRLGRLHGCGACRPQTPWGCAPCAPPGARLPCIGQSKARVGARAVGSRRLSTGRSNPRRRLGQAKRVRPVGRTPVGKGGGRCGVVGSAAVHKSMPTPLLSIGQNRHGTGAPLKARRRRSVVSFQRRIRARFFEKRVKPNAGAAFRLILGKTNVSSIATHRCVMSYDT